MKSKVISPEYLSIKQIAEEYCPALGERFIRDALKHPEYPLPHFRINQRTVAISRTDFDQWLQQFRVSPTNTVDEIVDEVSKDLMLKLGR